MLALSALLLAGCESSQSKSARLEKASAGGRDEAQFVVTERARGVSVADTTVLRDDNGAAAVVVLRNRTARPLAGIPLAIEVLGKDKRSLYKNDTPGLEESLRTVALLPARKSAVWVNDQVVATEAPGAVRARPGAGAKPARGPVPKLTVGKPQFNNDPVSGVEINVRVTNRSDVEQRNLIVYAVARDGRRIVAAGRGQIPRLKARGRGRASIFFIGDPRKGRLELSAPPTVLAR